MKLFRFLVTITILFSSSLYAQKVKYKDLYPLFQANKYTEAEPFLKRYLASDPDHANANYQLGLTYSKKAKSLNILTESDDIPAYADSAIQSLNKSKGLITEKEVKKRNEYYQSFSRRDLRTGKFGINISDVHLDIEDRIDALNGYKKEAQQFSENHEQMVKNYNTVVTKYAAIGKTFQNYQQLLLQSDQVLYNTLDSIDLIFQSFQANAKAMKANTDALKTDYYSPSLTMKDFEGISENAENVPDFNSSEIEVYNFSNWVGETKNQVNIEIDPLREDISIYYGSLESAISKVENQEAFDIKELDVSRKSELVDRTKEYDESTLLEPLFAYLEAELFFKWYSSPTYQAELEDSTNIDQQLKLHTRISKELLRMDSLSIALLDSFSESIVNYPMLTPDGSNVFEEELKNKMTSYKEELKVWEERQDFWEEKSRYALYDEISIPLYDLEEGGDFKYKTKAISISDSAVYASGIVGDITTSTLFLSQVNHSRIVNWLKEIKLTMKDVVIDSLEVQLLENESPGKTLFAFAPISQTDTTKIPFQGFLLKYSYEGEKSWELSHKFEGKPKFMEYDTLVSETKVYFDYINPSGEAEVSYILVDSSGKLR
ncbi:MAG: hypothetical protein AAF363_08565 [Bacteroidota bacterium]